MQFCPSCGKSIEDRVGFCPFCGHDLRASTTSEPASEAPAKAVASYPVTVAVPAPVITLSPNQIRAGDRGLTAALLNFLFWGVGYFQSGVKRPFGRSWLLWPLVYVAYAFAGQLLVFTLLPETESQIQTTIPNLNGTSGVLTTVGYNPYPALLTRDLEILAFLIPGIILGLFLARDAYRRVASASEDPGDVPSSRAALGSFLQRSLDQVNSEGIEANPAAAFSIVGGLLLILGSLYTTVLDWLSAQTLAIGGIGELEGAVLGALIIYVAISATTRPGWRQPGGVFIIAMALIVITVTREYAVELGFGIAIIGGALLVATSTRDDSKSK